VGNYNVGLCYHNSRGVKQNNVKVIKKYEFFVYFKAFQYLKKASDQRYAPASYQVGICHMIGNGTPECEENAIGYFKKAAREKHANSCFFLGSIYEAGNSVPKDIDKAIKWFSLGRDRNDSECTNAIQRLVYKEQ
jgi:TPR repeat protein